MIEERTKLCNRKNAKTGQNINAIETAHGIGNKNGNKKMDKTPITNITTKVRVTSLQNF